MFEIEIKSKINKIQKINTNIKIKFIQISKKIL